MAVVFISPKQRQKTFFIGITIVFLLILVAIASVVFFAQPKQNQVQLVFNKPKINIDFKIFDSDDFKNLKPFTEMELQFTYTATEKDGKPTQGLIAAVSEQEARNLLESMELTVTSIEEVKIGRDNPFAPYSQPSSSSDTTPASKTTKAKGGATTGGAAKK